MIWLLLLTLTMILSFALSGLESAVMSVSRVRVRHAASSGDRRAQRLLALLSDKDALLGAITVANHITNLAAFLIIAYKLLGVRDAQGHLTAFFLSLPLFLVGLEILPKKLFRRYPFRSIRFLSPLIHLVGLLRPLFRLFERPASTSLSQRQQAVEAAQSSALEDLRQQALALHRLQQISAGAVHLIEQTLGYRQLNAGQLMRPLNQSVALAPEIPISTALQLAQTNHVTTLPVLGEGGQFVGVMDLSTLPAVLPPDRLVRQHMRNLDSLPDETPALQALQRMRKRGRSICLVTNRQQEPKGILHEEDLISRLLRLQNTAHSAA